jgi:hypothetical protein
VYGCLHPQTLYARSDRYTGESLIVLGDRLDTARAGRGAGGAWYTGPVKNLAKNKVLWMWVVGGILGLSCCGFVGPWVLLWSLFVSEDLAKDYKLRRYQPTRLPDAVAYKYATPELVAGFIEKGGDVNQKLPGVNGAPPLPLISAATATDNVEVARLLLHRGAHVEEANVWRCARDGKEPMTRMLVEEGAALGRQPSYGEGIGPELIQAAAFGGQAWLVWRIAQQAATSRS